MRGKGYSMAVIGATGLVGEHMKQVLEEREFPVSRIRFLASERSEGKKVSFRGEEFPRTASMKVKRGALAARIADDPDAPAAVVDVA